MLQKNNQVRPPKLPVQKKRNILQQNQALARSNVKLLCEKRVVEKGDIPPSTTTERIRTVLQKTDLKWTHFQRKEIMSKNDLKLRLKFPRKVYCKRAACNCEM